MRSNATILAFVIVLVSGCIPERYDWRPGAAGRLIDSTTGKPIPGAKIELTGPVDYNNLQPVADAQTSACCTSDDGTFSFQPVRGWIPHWFLPWPMDRAGTRGRITITKAGYRERAVQVFEGSHDVGDIAMEK